MTLLIQKPTGAKLVMAQTYVGTDDPDAAAYIAAVETADGEALETATKVAIHSFVKGCKNDGIWPAIKASCILAGATTLTGALVPLIGTAPTNNNFVSGDYNRKTGLVGDTSTKYLNSNRNNNADPQNSNHNAVFISTLGSGAAIGTATLSGSYNSISNAATRSRNATSDLFTAGVGFVGIARSTSASYELRNNGATSSIARTSGSPSGGNILINGFNGSANGSHRLAFYSIGESLDLALLDARVTALINAFAAAIP